jgi:hypothetical protein
MSYQLQETVDALRAELRRPGLKRTFSVTGSGGAE